ncbi:hypothetical protein EVAR_71105_1 [Eumeta japonica]|uniref:Eukaryotic translation initiation factor 2D-like PUA RNA-binding domain-containing protein n=1 Tax=Eumeta variegata TaxID=151549 RepID=A0A4C1T859_EUMVA|nr:hypothetical protein EVAR_71105_1 [Eumeta japonica]
MLPGVVPQGIGMNMYGHYKKGQLAIGVGSLCKSSDDLYMSGGHGVAVKILHLFGDKLWGLEPSLVQQVPNFKNSKLSADDFPALGSEIHDKKSVQKVEKEINGHNLLNSAISNQVNNTETEVSSGSLYDKMELVNSSEEMPSNTPEMLLKHAFLSALKTVDGT